MTKLFYSNKPIIGLDISLTGIKVMAIDASKWRVLGYGSIDLDPGAVQKSLDNPENTYLSENISKLLKNHVIGTLGSDYAVIGVPTGKTFSRTFTVPTKEAAHIANALELEVEQYIPVPLSSLYVDYEIVEKTKDVTTAVLTAVPQTLVDSCLAAANNAGLTPVMVVPSIDAVARVLEKTEDGTLSTLIIDIGPATTDIAVLEGGAIRVTGSVGIGGNTFTLDIANKLDVSLENAHQLKVINGLSFSPRQAKITRALQPSLDRVVLEAKKVVRYYNERLNDEKKIEQVLIVGGGSNVPGIGEYFTNALVMPARVASPWQKLNFGKLKEPGKQFRPRYISVAGLASIEREEAFL